MPDERELIRKLVEMWHLNVPERRGLRRGVARASLIHSVIQEVLRETGWFPRHWRPDQHFDGRLIELLPDGTCGTHWRTEMGGGMGRTTLIEVVPHACSLP